MARRRRSRIEIVLSVLDYLAAEGGWDYATRIATATGLAYDRLVRLLEDLQARGILRIVEEEGRKRIVLTEKGYEALEKLRRVEEVLRDLGLA